MSLTGTQLSRIAPHCPNPDDVAGHLWQAMLPAGMTTVNRVAGLVGQCALECNEFRELGENDGSAISTSTWRGRGYIQLSTEANYIAAGKALGLDLVGNPELACVPENAARIAVWFFVANKLLPLCDAGNWRALSKAINGGYTDLDLRLAYIHQALAALGADAPIA